MDVMEISASALTAERTRMNLISSNLANANSTRTAEGGPYRRKDAVFAATLDEANAKMSGGVKVVDIVEDQSPPVVLAGDYTALPGVESAYQSGLQAARFANH